MFNPGHENGAPASEAGGSAGGNFLGTREEFVAILLHSGELFMSLSHLPLFCFLSECSGGLSLISDRGDKACIFVLEEDIFRILLFAEGSAGQTRSFAIAPGEEDVALNGRDRLDLDGFSLPSFAYRLDSEILLVETASIRLHVRLTGLQLSWDIRMGGEWRAAARDRNTQAYNFGWWDGGVYHYLQRARGERYYGLGERAGPMNRAGQRYRLTNIDAMGYSARTSDPLYKHIPFYITWKPEAGVAFGLFYDTLSDCVFDFGKELDNYHGPYRYFQADYGDLDYYFIAGPRVDDVTRRFTWLTGKPAFPPRWSLGYSGSTMSYTDAPDAQARMLEFLTRCDEHDILCDSFHLSSGYTSIDEKRYVFNWNRSKFPDPEGFARAYRESGVRLCANIKPCLLEGHPLLDEAASLGLVLSDENGEPYWTQFWDGLGVYLDFTKAETIDWWKAKVTQSLLKVGVAATWNDNNEYEIWSSTPLAHCFGAPRPACEIKPLQSLLMIRASRDAQREHSPGKRPFVVSRSGGAGMHRYAQSWSGDNFTSWETLKYNLKMGLGLALSGVSNIGHDVGGFAGPAPDPELFVRWVQFGIFLPRFSIHSWNDDGSVNEPWMHPQITPMVSELIKLRYRLLPYLYDTLWRYHSRYEPMIRPTFFDYPDDPLCWVENDDFMLGGALLVAPVVEPGRVERDVYLPTGALWYDYWSGEAIQGGQTVTRPAPWSRPALFVREGRVIPVNLAHQTFASRADRRGFLVFPPIGHGASLDEIYDDDGESSVCDTGEREGWRISVNADVATVAICVQKLGFGESRREPPVTLPESEARLASVRRL